MPKFRITHLFLFFLCFLVTTPRTCLGLTPPGSCIEAERQALVKFKKSLTDSYHRLSSWEGNDCCKWNGVSCDAASSSGHVLKLDFRITSITEAASNNSASGRISNRLEAPAVNSVLLDLKYLNHLDLSGNNFQYSSIPEFIGAMQHLRYLNLSNAYFSGVVPHSLGNLSGLKVLDLHLNNQLTVDDLIWVSRLSSLQWIDLSGADLSQSPNNLIKVLTLPFISQISLSNCRLNTTHLPPTSSVKTLSKIQDLDLSVNLIEGELPSLFRNMTSLRTLDLSNNLLNSSVPRYLGVSHKTLVHLNLAANRFDSIEGGLSMILWKQCQLKSIDLSSNMIHGEIIQLNGTGCIAYDLESLRINFNKFSGELPQRFLGQLKNLKVLGLTENLFSGTIPASVGGLSALRELDLSYNQLAGVIPASLGQLSALRMFDLEGNKLTGSIPASIGGLSGLLELDLSFNRLNGVIPASIGKLTSLRRLNLGFNRLSGTMPVSLGLLSKLESLELCFNSLEGLVSEVHFANISMLKYVDVRSNPMLMFKMRSDWIPPFQLSTLLAGSCKLGPQFPPWLQTQKELVNLNLSSSGISGALPSWLRGMPITSLLVSNNQITGPLSNLPSSIQYLELSHNSITGHLISPFPSALTDVYLSHNRISGPLTAAFASKILFLDISSNELVGEIPQELTGLTALAQLNLSRNRLTGGIPENIGDMISLTSLDFSSNHLTGMIPQSITALSSLNHLNLSYNNLSGRIPAGNHVQVLSDPSIYAGNPELCGAPLTKKCPK